MIEDKARWIDRRPIGDRTTYENKRHGDNDSPCATRNVSDTCEEIHHDGC